MFKLFGKKKPAAPEDRLAFCKDKRDWAGLARACYELGVSAMERGEPNRAQLWLHRADTIYSAKDEVYEAVGEKLADDCSARIGQLEEAHILYNNLPSPPLRPGYPASCIRLPAPPRPPRKGRSGRIRNRSKCVPARP